jgi:hypothetical protein
VNDANSLDLTTGVTIEAWVFPTTSPTNWKTIILKEQPNDFTYALYGGSPSGTLPSAWIYISSEENVQGSSSLPLNTWSHLAATYDGVTLKLYVMGTQVGSRALTGSIVTSGGPVRIGGNSIWTNEFYKGMIDEVRIYNRALPPSEIQTDMNSPIGDPSPASPMGLQIN